VEFVLVGGFAAVAHGAALVTRAVDMYCRFTETNLMRIQRALSDLCPVHRQRPDIPLDLTPELCASLKSLYLKSDMGRVDCLGEILGVGDFDAVTRQSVPVELPVGTCHVLGLEALIRAKEAMGRDHDKITVKPVRDIQKRS
jgi:hypothetical protein